MAVPFGAVAGLSEIQAAEAAQLVQTAPALWPPQRLRYGTHLGGHGAVGAGARQVDSDGKARHHLLAGGAVGAVGAGACAAARALRLAEVPVACLQLTGPQGNLNCHVQVWTHWQARTRMGDSSGDMLLEYALLTLQRHGRHGASPTLGWPAGPGLQIW
jgi:hypothetical protein